MGAGMFAPHHVVGNQAAHPVHFDNLDIAAGSGDGSRLFPFSISWFSSPPKLPVRAGEGPQHAGTWFSVADVLEDIFLVTRPSLPEPGISPVLKD